MMEVTQNVELKELSTGEEKLLQSIVSELNHKVDDANPEKEATIKRNNAIVVKEICNGLDVKDSENNIDSSTHLNSIDKHSDRGSSTERDAGSDLDALLDKITSIVDGDPKESAEEERKQSSLAIKTVEDIDHEKIADPANDCTEPKMIDGIKANKKEVQSYCVHEAKDAKLVATGKEILEGSDQKTLNNTDICGTKAAVIVSDAEKTAENKNNINAAEVLNADEIDPVATTPILNNSNDELFLDALDNISSSDEFEVLAENNPKIEKESVEKECKNGAVDIALENISSSDEYEVLAENNPKIEKESVEKECKHGAVDITSEDSNDKVIPCMEKTREEVSIIDLDTSEECLTETQDSKMTKKPAAHKKSDVGKTEESNSKEKIVQEMNDKSTDKICAEAIESSESCTKETKHEEEANEKESEGSVEANKNILGTSITEPKQTLEKESMPTDGLSNPNDQKLDKKDPDSDDEVIFFEPIKKLEETTIADKGKECKVIKPSSETDKKENAVVLLSEDEEDDLLTAEQPAKELSKNLHKTEDQTNGFIGVDLSADNSDNACDQFEKVKSREKAKVNTIDDVNSNSSNLLQPSQKSRGECIPVADTDADAEPAANPEPEADPNVELEDDNEDMVVEETEYEQHAIPPAVKRIRLSTDHKTETSNTSSCTTNDTCSTTATTITTNDEEVQQTVGKRSHSLLSTNSPESQKEETPSKKLKADDSDSNSSIDGTLQIDLDAHEQTKLETETSVPDVKTSEPVADLDIPIELKPKPELKCDVKPLRLEFVKSFRKSFDKMTRYDLEELVLQKVVESMLVKSEFAEIRRQVDNHEVTLSNYRRKIAEVSKQYLDLETVHKRVLKDLETKNAHFTAPVRITRAVGLQVGMTLMKKPSEESRTHHTAGSMPAPSQAIGSSSSPSTMQTPPKASTSPLRSTMRPGRPITRPQPNTEQQQNLQHQAQLARSTIPFAQASASSNSSPVRRGCMQKVTPQRPVNNHASQTVFNQSVQQQRMQASQTLQSQRTPMFVSKHTTVSTSPAATVVPAAASAMRQRGPTAKPGTYSSMTHKLQQQQQQQQQQPLPVRIGRSPAKQQQSAVSVTSKQRLMPIGGGTVSVPMLNAQESGAGAAGYGQPSLAPARPKEKAVIDLTDEDDAAAAAAAAVLAAAEASARLRPPNVTVKRSMQSTPVSGARPVAGSVVRVSPMNMPRANAVARQIVSNNGSGQRGSLGSNIPLHTTRSENTPPSGSRSRLSHPAPLPLAPAQTFHPDWKLPPSRPIIRISLHETGIVISWTLEDTGSRFAECVTYQIYAYQETINEPSTDSWRHVGDVKAMLLPMAVTLNQFQENQRYFFAVRGVDAHERYGVFSLPKTW